MTSLSVCMIVKNEEDVLSRCLDCIKDIADEIVIIDTGSKDRTKNIAKQYTPFVFDFEWCDDFSAARNYSFSKATKEYCMWLDADDVIDEINRQKLIILKKNLKNDIDIVYLKYDVAFDEQDNPTMSYYRERIFKTASKPKWTGEIHEVVPSYGTTTYEDISIFHKKTKSNPPERNLKIFKKMLKDGKILDSRQKYYYARELYYNGYYDEAIFQFKQFLNGADGWIENKIGACKDLADCFYIQNKNDDALRTLFMSFSYDIPRAEICCDIGKHFLNTNEYFTSIFWYKIAASLNKNDRNGGFCFPDCYGYIPYIQLCVCYDRLGDRENAILYNEKAGAIKPYDPSYLYNKEYFLASRKKN